MLAILAAAAVVAATPLPGQKFTVGASPKACGYWQLTPTQNRAPDGRSQQLGDLPKANHELAVLQLDASGCSKAVIVREKVNGDGRFANPR